MGTTSRHRARSRCVSTTEAGNRLGWVTDITDDAWRKWVLDWDAKPGKYTIQVRATDKDGATQTEEIAPPDPDGATGYHTRSITVAST